jgi:enoyl-CoA hydratase/carnithine racemase
LVTEVGASRARELLLFGKTLDAATARDWGLVAHVDERPLDRALHLASSIIGRDRMSLAATKLLLADQLEASRGVGAEAVVQALLYGRRERPTII